MSDDPAIIDHAAQILRITSSQGFARMAEAVLAAVTPLIRAAALEEAAVVAEEYPDGGLSMEPPWVKAQIAGAIRTLKEQP